MNYDENVQRMAIRMAKAYKADPTENELLSMAWAQQEAAVEAVAFASEQVKSALITWANHGCHPTNYLKEQGLIPDQEDEQDEEQ